MFVEQPIIPLAILFHDFKKQRTHNRFIQILHDEIPQFSKHCVLVTDGEDALKNAFRFYYPQLDQLRCWNHLGQNIKAAAKTHYVVTQQTADVDGNDPTVLRKQKKEIISNAVDTITNLLRAPSKLDFMNEYNNISQTWPSGFRDWINKNLFTNN